MSQYLDRPARPKPGKVWLVGAGPGAADLITVRGARILADAEVVLHDALDGAAINDGCGSTHPESLQAAVLEHGAGGRERILDASLQLLAKEGVQALTQPKVCRAAGIRQSLVRVAVGLEHLDDLKADLSRGLDLT